MMMNTTITTARMIMKAITMPIMIGNKLGLDEVLTVGLVGIDIDGV